MIDPLSSHFVAVIFLSQISEYTQVHQPKVRMENYRVYHIIPIIFPSGYQYHTIGCNYISLYYIVDIYIHLLYIYFFSRFLIIVSPLLPLITAHRLHCPWLWWCALDGPHPAATAQRWRPPWDFRWTSLAAGVRTSEDEPRCRFDNPQKPEEITRIYPGMGELMMISDWKIPTLRDMDNSNTYCRMVW
jgi:hypothetical protein